MWTKIHMTFQLSHTTKIALSHDVTRNLNKVLCLIRKVFTMFFGQACKVVAKDISELIPTPGTYIGTTTSAFQLLLNNFSAVNPLAVHTYSSSRCSWSDSGSGWRGTHPSLTAILPTFVSTLLQMYKYQKSSLSDLCMLYEMSST